MKTTKPWKTLALMLIVALSPFAIASGQEKAVRMKDLPPAVQATVKEQSKGARIRGLAMEIENGKTFYEVEMTIKGHSKDVLMDTEGKVVEIEEQVALHSLPAAVKAEILKQAGNGRILLVESVMKPDTLVFYEAHIKSGAKIREIKITPDGKPTSDG